MRAVIHVNPAIDWQRKYADALAHGLDERSVKPVITHKKTLRGDITIILGPHWCLDDHRHHRCLYIDRAYWGDPDAVSVHWIEGGEKVFDWSGKEGRWCPELQPMKWGSRTVALWDYGRPIYHPGATPRPHPSGMPQAESLESVLSRHEIAVGGRSTALVDAAIAGLRVITDDRYSPVFPISFKADPDREHWIRSLSWHNWSLIEIEQGELWNHFLT